MNKFRVFFGVANVMIVAILVFTVTALGQERSRSNDVRQPARTAAPSSLLVENFDYPAATLLVASGWAAHSAAGTNALTVTAPGLTYSGYAGSGIGNGVALASSGEDANRTFPVQTTGSVYVGLMVNVATAAADATNGDYFFHLGPDPIGTTFRGRLFVKQDANNMLAFGISKGGTNATPANITFTPFSYAQNTTHLIIIKYTIVAGTTNDTIDVFVNPTLGGAEPAVTITVPDVAGFSDINPGSFAIRQGTAATGPAARVDGIRVSTSWASLFTVSPDAPVDFNGDGKTDFVVARNNGGQLTWFWNINGTGSATAAAAWGLNNDILAPGDFDGDNKDDIAVWRPAAALTAGFYILQSQTSTFRFEQFGQTGDNPTVIADYNGDGKDDVAVYRGGTPSTWYYRTTAGGPVTYVPWGTNGDFVAPGDYDGDGIADFGVQRNAAGAGEFWIRLSNGTVQPVQTYGLSTDVVITSDFDGDAKSDLAVWRNGIWYIRPSSGAADQIVVFGLNSDTLAPGDYDGDGRSDIAVFRDGVFYVRATGGGAVSYFTLGAAGDRVPASYNTH